jgi:hypothetical protein
LGRAGSPKHRQLMERYLHDVGDPQISALALMALCSWWELIDAYRGELISFLNGVDWDAGDYVKLQAIGIAGEYLRKNEDSEILRIIYSAFSNETERLLIRSAAYHALCRSDGVEWRDMLPASRVVDFSREINPAIISRVEKKLCT